MAGATRRRSPASGTARVVTASRLPAWSEDERRLSLAIDRAVRQAESAEARGDLATARAWRRVLRDLERRIPDDRP